MTAPLILTAPAAQQGRWQSALTALGVEVQGVPLIDIVVAPLETLESAWAAVMRGPRLVIFVSPSAVAALDAVAGLKWIGWPRPVMTGCVGPATAQALRLRGVRVIQFSALVMLRPGFWAEASMPTWQRPFAGGYVQRTLSCEPAQGDYIVEN